MFLVQCVQSMHFLRCCPVCLLNNNWKKKTKQKGPCVNRTELNLNGMPE